MVDPWEIKDHYVYDQNFMPHFDQYRYIYEAMLRDTASVDFTHHYVEEKNLKSAVKYRKAVVKRIMKPENEV